MSYPQRQVDALISTCHHKDVATFLVASKYILKHISAEKYYVIVPDIAVAMFSKISSRFIVISESSVIDHGLMATLRSSFPTSLPFGWYLQQYLKLEMCVKLQDIETILIWDADTIPVRNIQFFDDDDSWLPFITLSKDSDLSHPLAHTHYPYIQTILRLFPDHNLMAMPLSYISQHFLTTSADINQLRTVLECDSKAHWLVKLNHEALHSPTNHRFSEYELLGYFTTQVLGQSRPTVTRDWIRTGAAMFWNPLHFLISHKKKITELRQNTTQEYFVIEQRHYRYWNIFARRMAEYVTSFLAYLFHLAV